MKIAMVSMNAGPLACLGGVEGGGQSVVIDCLSRALSVGGHAVTILTQQDDPARSNGSPPAIAMPALHSAIAAFSHHLHEEWSADRPDVVHAHSWMSGKAAVAAAKVLDIPVVQTFHGLGRSKRGRADCADVPGSARVDEEAALIRSAARIVATSSAEVFALLRMGASPGAIKLIPCGVDLELFAPRTDAVARGDQRLRIATLSRLVPDAGVSDVIEALRFVDDVDLIVGGGPCAPHDLAGDPDAARLAALTRARGLSERVTFAGHIERPAVPAFLRSADLVICAPWYDSIGTVALEAMACGVPVIVSAVGGHLDAVVDGLSGLHVPAQAPRQIAYAIEALRSDAARRARFGRFGIERTAARYGWPRIAADTLEVYASVTNRTAQLSRGT